jgi:hypothetical protein
MKALNIKERNSAIFRFSLWLFICVLIICVPLILAVILPAIRDIGVNKGDQDELVKLKSEILFYKDTLSLQIRDICEIEKKFYSDKSKVATYNMELMNIAKNLEADTAGKAKWKVEMCRNISSISKDLIEANEILGKSEEGKSLDQDKLNSVIIEFQSVADDVSNLLNYKSKNTLHDGLVRIDKQLKKAVKLLEALK